MPLNTDPNTPNDITLAVIPPADGASVTNPNPQDIVGANVQINTNLTISSSDINFAVTGDVTYTPVAVTDEVTDESLNRTAETLKVSVNAKLESLGAAIQTAMRNIGASADLTAELQAKLDAIVTGVNAGFAEIRTAEAAQTADVMAIITTKVGEMMAETQKVLEMAENSQAKIAALDDTYGTDSDIAAKVANINNLINTLGGTDSDFLEALDAVIDRVNDLLRIQVKSIDVTAANGVYAFAFANEGLAAFVSANDYMVEVFSETDPHVQARVSAKTAAGFTASVVSKDVHYQPVPSRRIDYTCIYEGAYYPLKPHAVILYYSGAD